MKKEKRAGKQEKVHGSQFEQEFGKSRKLPALSSFCPSQQASMPVARGRKRAAPAPVKKEKKAKKEKKVGFSLMVFSNRWLQGALKGNDRLVPRSNIRVPVEVR